MFKPIPKDGEAAKKTNEANATPATKPERPRVHRYRWPGEYSEGRGDFNRVSEDQNGARRKSDWMR